MSISDATPFSFSTPWFGFLPGPKGVASMDINYADLLSSCSLAVFFRLVSGLTRNDWYKTRPSEAAMPHQSTILWPPSALVYLSHISAICTPRFVACRLTGISVTPAVKFRTILDRALPRILFESPPSRFQRHSPRLSKVRGSLASPTICP